MQRMSGSLKMHGFVILKRTKLSMSDSISAPRDVRLSIIPALRPSGQWIVRWGFDLSALRVREPEIAKVKHSQLIGEWF
jgi:hypothetical protein